MVKKAIFLGSIGEKAILNRGGEYQPFVVAAGYDEERGDWMSGDYFQTFQNAVIYALAELGEETPTTVQMQRVSYHYQIANLTDYLVENYKVDRVDGWDWATEVHRMMREDDVSEDFAINATKGRYKP